VAGPKALFPLKQLVTFGGKAAINSHFIAAGRAPLSVPAGFL
jgi:hypothetical protein